MIDQAIRKILYAFMQRHRASLLNFSRNDWRRVISHSDYLKRQARSGNKARRKAFEGNLGLRGKSLSGASLMAQQGNLCNVDKNGIRRSL
jgi:hypothetical protein